MVRRLLLIACAIGVQLAASAQQRLNIYTTTQGVVSFEFAQKPVVTFVAPETLVVKSETTEVEFPYADVQKLTFEDVPTAVESLSVSENAATAILVYDIAGKLIRKVETTKGTALLDLSGLRPGVYIVKDGVRSYKVSKK